MNCGPLSLMIRGLALDGFSRYIVHWEIREQMEETDVETVVQRALEKYPDTGTRTLRTSTWPGRSTS
jgi:transposase InsO family protein